MTHKIQINDVVRDATPDEAAELDAMQAKALTDDDNHQIIVAERTATRNSALAKLKVLGLSDAEIAAVVGG